MAHEVEVKTRLTLDDHASHALERVKHGFEHVNEEAKEVSHELIGMAKQAIATAAGFQLSGVISSFEELGHEAFNAARAVEDQRKGLRGVLAMGDTTGASMEQLGDRAASLKDELEEMGVAAGENADVIINSFQELAARSGKSEEALKELTSQMVYAGKAVPGGLQAITSGFEMMEMGMVRARNPLVMMIKQTGLMTGTAKQVAAALTKMAQAGRVEEVMKLGEQAIGRMSDKMKAAPASFGGVIESIKTMRENLFETLGLPVLDALIPPLNQLKHYFMDNREEIEKFAHTIGTKVGEWVKAAAEKIKEGFQYLQTHADEIESAISTAFNGAKAVIDFILAHKEEIAIAFGAKMAVQGAGAIGSVVSGAMSLAGGLGEAGEAAGAVGTIGKLAAGAASLVNPVTAATAAVAALGIAAYQYKGMLDDLDEDSKQRARTILDHFHSMSQDTGTWTQAMRDDMEKTRQEGLLLAQKLGDAGLAGKMNEMAEAATKGHEGLRKIMEPFETAAKAIPAAPDATGAAMPGAVDAYTSQLEASGDAMANAINQAAAAHSDAAIRSQASYIAHSARLQDALLSSSTLTSQGFDELIKTLEVMSPELAARLKGARESLGVAAPGEKPATGEKPPGAVIHMPGAHINIHQDFRDQDPDRVALVFQRDLVRAATATRQSKLAGVFGV
jgi:hypothetical protein